jgi:curved DNA-binding protein CbpA
MSDSLENQYDNESFIDYYKILDVDSEATTEEIKKRYIELAKRFHPDQKDGDTEKFQLITKAFEVLNNRETRKEYDLYYLKKSYDEIKEDDFKSLKEQFNEFTKLTDKKMDKEELDKIYTEIFKDRDNFVENRMNEAEIYKRLNDINFEREALEIEETDETIKKILVNNPNLETNEIIEYLNEITPKNNQLMNPEIQTMDMMPSYYGNDCSFLNDIENIDNMNYSSFEMNEPKTKKEKPEFNIEEFTKWKTNKVPNTKLDNKDIELFLARRKQQEEELINEVDTNLATNVRRKNIEKFLQFET